MTKNFFKVAYRSLIRRKTYTIIALAGLSISLFFLFTISNYVNEELSVNKSLLNVSNQNVLLSRWKVKERGSELGTPAPIGPTLKQKYPNIINDYYRCYGVGAIVNARNVNFQEDIQIGDSTLLKLYGFKLKYGDPKSALTSPNSIVITSSLAMKYYGQVDAVNKTLIIQTPIGKKQLFKVTGILNEIKSNSVTNLRNFNPQLFIPMQGIKYFVDEAQMQSWDNNSIITYLETNPNYSIENITNIINNVLKENVGPDVALNLKLQVAPLLSFYKNDNNGAIKKIIYTLMSVALFILIMAIVNYINLTLGLSSTRLREIGVRRSLGSSKSNIIIQFFLEAFLLTTIGAILAIVSHEIFKSKISDLLKKDLPSIIYWPWYTFIILVVIIFVISIASGLYPALILSNLPIIKSIRGKMPVSSKLHKWTQNFLITSQFVVAGSVFIGSIIINSQVDYFTNLNLGFPKEKIISIKSVPRDWSISGISRLEGIRNQLALTEGIQSVSISFEIPNGKSGGNVNVFRLGQDSTQFITAGTLTTDEKFAQTYDLQMKAGKFFNENGGSYDSSAVVINQSAVNALGFNSNIEAINQLVRFRGETYRISGVTSNFHFSSVHNIIKPLVFIQLRKDPIYRYLSLRLKSDHYGSVIENVEKSWLVLFPEAPFSYTFMDDTVNNMYETELKLKKTSNLATFLAFTIVIIGIFGVVSLSISKRTKEIGVRKVLGATFPDIVLLFLKSYYKIIILACIIFWPLTYFYLKSWLDDFAYKIEVSIVPFISVSIIFLFFTTIIVCIQLMKSLSKNPIKTLQAD